MKKVLVFLQTLMLVVAMTSCNYEDISSNESKKLPTNAPTLNQDFISQSAYAANLYKAIANVQMTGNTIELYIENEQLHVKKIIETTKDERPPDFWDCDKEKFYDRVDKELKNGNTVVITYDDETGCYFGWIYPPPKP